MKRRRRKPQLVKSRGRGSNGGAKSPATARYVNQRGGTQRKELRRRGGLRAFNRASARSNSNDYSGSTRLLQQTTKRVQTNRNLVKSRSDKENLHTSHVSHPSYMPHLKNGKYRTDGTHGTDKDVRNRYKKSLA